ncbi:unnamed protein product [Pseudo-nitzschia multistriata]|uniref:Methyltransferase domain-containing protein n=1 Tax=Pseudo-nitzschia multistriata TaxID=183589 RepID=A0A448ZGE3_9STRA|nr:unnamed protein product [Pseudo-nitzschia multistriata]
MKLRGFITRRRCMGKNLAFADVLVEECDDESSILLSPPEQPPERKIEVMFQRGTPEAVWDSEIKPTNHEFPTKNSALPYGALVFLDVRVPAKGKIAYRVEAWKIKVNPKEGAIMTAREGRSEGVSCSIYLQKRCEAFSKFNGEFHKLGPKKKDVRKSNLEGESPLDNRNKMKASDVADFSHGTNKMKGMRATIFATWLVDTYGKDNLARGGGVLDVAGGKGKLSIQLALQGKIQSTVIDPLVRKHGKKFDPIGARRIKKAQAPHPTLLSKEFNRTTFLEISEQEDLVKNSSMLVGLHPDEPTEDILDMALQYEKNVAIVPCCVFPCFFPLRHLSDGKFVRTYEDFLEYLLAKDDRLRKHTLPFQGRNIVIYMNQNKAGSNSEISNLNSLSQCVKCTRNGQKDDDSCEQ